MSRRIGILVFRDVTMLDVTGPAEVFCRAKDPETGRPGYEISIISAQGGNVSAFGGLTLANTIAADEIDSLHTLLIAGGDTLPHRPLNPTLLEVTAKLAGLSDRIGSVCTGAFILAELGLLDGRRATTHWLETSELAKRHPKILVDPGVLHTKDGNIHTSAGISAGIDLALSMVEDDHGAGVARAIAREIVVYMHRPGNQSQFSSALEAPIRQSSPLRVVLDGVRADPTGTHDIASMAQLAALSERHLRRLFKNELGTTPTHWLERVRIDRACQLLIEGHSVTKTAELSGFANDERLRRAFARHLDATPSQYRERFTSTH